MPAISIITDSTCDVPPALIERYGIVVLPYLLIWDGVEYRDRVTIQPEEFYTRLASSNHHLPTTAQASPMDFARLFAQARAQGAEGVLALLVNGRFSGSLGSAQQAAAEMDIPVHVHDSRSTSMGLGWQVLAAARAREAGGDLASMVAAAESARERVQLVACLDTLEYVYRGGRIGNASRLLGSVLHARPVIYVDHHTGQVEGGGMALSHRRAVELMLRRFFNRVGPSRLLHVAVMHGMAEAEALALEARIRAEYRPVEIFTHITGPILGMNTGPGALALSGYGE